MIPLLPAERASRRNGLHQPALDPMPESYLRTSKACACIPAGSGLRHRRVRSRIAWMIPLLGLLGCAKPQTGPIVFYLDGAGWYTGGGGVERGLRRAGYNGAFETYTWSAFLGPAHDHLMRAGDRQVAKGLAERIEAIRKNDPDGPIYMVGLSAGTAVLLNAISQLPTGVNVDSVVLLSPTVSAERDLTPIMRHVRGKLYATSSQRDGIVGTLAVNADGKRGPPAGEAGFKLPRGASNATREAYARVVNIPWKPAYIGFDWDGGHAAVTDSHFFAAVIAPRLLSTGDYPLDRPLARVAAAREEEDRP